MRHGKKIREEAIELRHTQGLSFSEVGEILGVSKSTVRYWLWEIPIPAGVEVSASRKARIRAGQLAGAAANQAKNAALRKTAYQEAYNTASDNLQDQDIRDFVILYLAEGYRKNRNTVALSNSNPHIVRFAHNCLRRLSTNPHFSYSFQYHADQDPSQLKQFWASYLGIGVQSIMAIAKTNSGHMEGRRFACEHGIFMVRVGDTSLRARLQALMDVVQEQWADTK